MIPTVHPTAENGLSKPRASGDDPAERALLTAFVT